MSARSLQLATQQGAAPDRLQLRSFLAPLPAAGELGRYVTGLKEH
jgi:hypothetical protein